MRVCLLPYDISHFTGPSKGLLPYKRPLPGVASLPTAAMLSEKQVAIIGAGVSGLLACKHLLEAGFDPVVFESHGRTGGVWVKGAIESTRLQTPKSFYQFSDFPWPQSMVEEFPDHRRVVEYLDAYVEEFGLLPRIRFNRRVTEIGFAGNEGKAADWKEWGGTGEAFSLHGKWKLTVEDSLDSGPAPEVYRADFVILCIGMFSDLPRTPAFPVNEGPEVFDGKVLHSMDYAMMEWDHAVELVRGKRVVVVGFQKSSLDIAAEVSKRNDKRYPCTLLFREAHWALPDYLIKYISRNLNRFMECMIHKPGEGLFLCLLASLLSPLMWIFSKLMESYLRWKYPLKRYGTVPEHSLNMQFQACMTPTLPPQFYDVVEEGSLILKKLRSFSFCKNGVIIDGDASKVVMADVVILATGFKSDEKLKSIFASLYFRKCMAGSSAPLYRECIHPRIPQVAILGYMNSFSVLHATEMRSKWLAHFLMGAFKLPGIREMEADVTEWERCARSYSKERYKRYQVSALLQIYCNDILCRDMGCNPRRKRSLLAELFAPYGPADYRGLAPPYLQKP
ncbi:probable flavin-containing monooxygenase 1 [Punica granatum]|uniref:Flavin-containing monooxygenase n=1 Tax=Punica granatum TaxID=22663 RepID=A0A6P8E442_PUNGR|nr:probable flavin-containing monooxygenase 1 [Punica granatum]